MIEREDKNVRHRFMEIDRRRVLQSAAATTLGASAFPGASDASPHMNTATSHLSASKADHIIEISNGLLEIGSETAVSTKLYNNQFPGPLLRLHEGKPVTVEIRNNSDTPEQLHWHGQALPPDVDGAAEEGTPYIQPHTLRRVT